MSINRVTLLGHITADAQVRQGDGWSIANFGVATSEKWTTKQGEQKEVTEFHNIELSGMAGVYQYLVKGQLVYVEGSIRTDRWTDQNGQQKESKKIRANILQLCGGRQQSPQQGQQQYAAQQQAPQYPQQYQQQPQYQRGGYQQPQYNNRNFPQNQRVDAAPIDDLPV